MELMNEQEQKLVERHLPIVRTIVLGTIQLNESMQGMGYDDLYQTGCEALCHAALHYQSDRGASFKTFATIVIKNQLLSHCRHINRIQFPLEYLDAPVDDTSGMTYGETLSKETGGYSRIEDTDIFYLLAEAGKDYTGITQKGTYALKLKCMGYSNIEIASHYGVKPNHIAAWISRAGSRLRTDRRFTCLRKQY